MDLGLKSRQFRGKAAIFLGRRTAALKIGQMDVEQQDVRWRGQCQNSFKAPTLDEEGAQLCRTELAPLGESGGAVPLEFFAAVEMALLFEMMVHG